ncbi:MAG: hypothetical protein PHN31_00385 [Candidatus Gracilibacteria bacterium]|nr:hypothetical protein [Candidatus Gracilibacteria bacterium]
MNKIKFFSNPLKLVKNEFSDVLILFKNFIHWNTSKILIFVYSVVFGILLALPFFAITLFLYYYFGLGEYFSSYDIDALGLFSLLNDSFFAFLSFSVFVFLLVICFFVGFGYRKVLLYKLNFSYLDGKNLRFEKNYYFKFDIIKKYILVELVILFLLSLPILLFILTFFILLYSFGGVESVQTLINANTFNIFSILLLFLFIICGVLFAYIYYRLYFSVVFLVDGEKNEEKKEVKQFMYYLKKSFLKTKKVKIFVKFIIVFIFLKLLTTPFSTIEDYYTGIIKDIDNYRLFSSFTDEQKKSLEQSSDSYYLNQLKLEFADYKNEEINKMYVYNMILKYFFKGFNFLVVIGLLEMVVISFYRREID